MVEGGHEATPLQAVGEKRSSVRFTHMGIYLHRQLDNRQPDRVD